MIIAKFLKDFVIIFESINEISCPKTDVPKECVFLLIVEFFFCETKLLKKRKEVLGLPSL
jgi:hypothetical protein